MPLSRPTLPQLISRTVADMQSRLPGSDPLKRFSVLGALAHAMAYGLHGLYGLLDYFARQSNPATATGRYLELWASVWLDVPRLAATPAVGSVDITGTAGAAVPIGLQFQSSAGIEYATTETAAIGEDGTVTILVRATSDGADTNLPVAALLNLINPTVGIDSQAYVGSGSLSGGADAEDDERLRARLVQRIQNPPHGGAQHDYERWALEVAAVERQWVVPLYSGDGTVRVWIGEADYAGADLASASLVDQTQAYIESPARKPVTANVTVAAPSRVPVDIDITAAPQGPAVYAAIRAELAQVFERDAAPEGQILISRLREAVSIAAGESDNQINAPTANVQAGTGEILTLGTVTFT